MAVFFFGLCYTETIFSTRKKRNADHGIKFFVSRKNKEKGNTVKRIIGQKIKDFHCFLYFVFYVFSSGNIVKVVIAADSFKGSLTSLEVGNAVKEGIQKICGQADIEVCPLADGGEGTVEALVKGMGGERHPITVTGPLGTPVNGSYGILPNSGTAVLEMAEAAGITLVPEDKRNPLHTTTYGVGEMIKDAMSKGCTRFLVGIGGSSTNDGGIGMLQALGFSFLNQEGHQVAFGAKGLEELESISMEKVIPELRQCRFRIACDVTNPMCGSMGCSAVFGPQKGADRKMIAEMDQWLRHYAELAKKHFPKADEEEPGTGAAGGLGFAFRTFTDAVLESGIQIVLEETRLEEKIKDADLVITGEGRLDGQTAMGKAPTGVAKLAKKYGKPVVALAGSVTRDASACHQEGLDAFFPVLRGICTLEEAMDRENARSNIRDTAEQVMRLFLAGKK